MLIPIQSESTVDPASDAWFEALEEATAPRVLPSPQISFTSCNSLLGQGVDDTRDAEPMHGVSATDVSVLSGMQAVTAFAKARSLSLNEQDTAALSAASPSGMFVALVYELYSTSNWTETVRIVYPSPAVALPLGLLGSHSAPRVGMTLYTLADGRARPLPAVSGAMAPLTPELSFSDVAPSWFVRRATSNYRERRTLLLESKAGAEFLLESSGTSALFDAIPLFNGTAISPVVERYFERAYALGESSGDIRDCKRRLMIARDDGARGLLVGKTCAPGLLVTPAQSLEQARAVCMENPTVDQIDPERLRCGGADDLAMAFSGHRPDKVRLTRHSLILGTSSGNTDLEIFDGPVVSSVQEASAFDAEGCGNASGGASGAGGSAGRASGAGLEPGAPPGGAGYPRDPDAETHGSYTGSGVTCSGDGTQGSDASCSGDSSAGSDDGSESCSNDDSSGYDGETCSDDSSDASGEDGETCSDDSSDSSGYDGDTCSGDGQPGEAKDDCSVPRRPRGRTSIRPRLSLLTLGLAALLLPIRRRGRRPARPRPR